jgi:hypothetical protein
MCQSVSSYLLKIKEKSKVTSVLQQHMGEMAVIHHTFSTTALNCEKSALGLITPIKIYSLPLIISKTNSTF